MPIEVFCQEYIILPPHQTTTSYEWANVPEANLMEELATLTKNVAETDTDSPMQEGIIHTLFHDLESLWWVGVWILFCSATNACLLEDVERRIEVALTIFPHFGATVNKFQTRSRVFRGEKDFVKYIQQLPKNFAIYGVLLDQCRSSLYDAYLKSRVPGKDLKNNARFEPLLVFRKLLSAISNPASPNDIAIRPLLEVYKSLTELKRKADTPADGERVHTNRK